MSVEESVLRYIAAHGGRLKLSDCAAELGFSREEVRQALDSLMKQGRLERVEISRKRQRLEAKRKELQTELKKLPVRLSVGEISASEYEARKGQIERGLLEIENKMSSVTMERITSELPKLPPRLRPESISALWDERVRIVRMLETLEKKKRSITDKSYQALKSDYDGRLRRVDSVLKSSRDGLLKMLETLQARRGAYKEKLDELEARQAVGELGMGPYKKQKEEITDTLSKLQDTIGIVKDLTEKLSSI